MNFDARSLMTTVPNPDDPAIQTLHAGKGTGRGNVITLAVFVLALPALSNRAWADQPTSVLTTVDVPGATLTLARGCPGGDIVGNYLDSQNKQHGFLLSNGKLTTIDMPGATATVALGIDGGGDIVGSYFAGGLNQIGRAHV